MKLVKSEKLKYASAEQLEELSSLMEENRVLTEELIGNCKNRYEGYLKDIFLNVPDACLDGICATAEAYDMPLTGGIYFIRNNYSGAIKIGCSENIVSRFNQLKGCFRHLGMEPSLSLVSIVLAFPRYLKSLETQYHSLFERKRGIGEWFDISEDDICTEIFGMSDRCEFINGVLFDYAEHENEFFENVGKSYAINRMEALKILDIEDLRLDPFPFPVFEKQNKLLKIVEVAESNGIGFHEKIFSNGSLWQFGIKHLETSETIDFQQLKERKFDKKYWEDVISSLNAS